MKTGPFKKYPLILFTLLAFAAPSQAHILKVDDSFFVDFETMIMNIKEVPLIFMGELHDNEGHHHAQLQVIRALHERGVPVAIGLEMFRRDSQEALDAWVDGRISLAEFLPVYYENWSMWEAYDEIFRYARENNIPMVGLNISREITQKVSREGFDSLTPAETGQLPVVRCNVDEKYQAYIRRVLGGHAHNGANFLNFCEAQLLWDVAMAHNLMDYVDENPERTVVVLAGSGHAWKYGIPEQIRRQTSDLDYRVLLPAIPGRVTADDVTIEEADYLMLGVEEAPLH